MFNLVQRLKARGIPVDGIGAQAHLIVGSVPTTIATNWANFATLGVDIHVTELDIRMVSLVVNVLLYDMRLIVPLRVDASR